MQVVWIVCALALAATVSAARVGSANAQSPLQRACEAKESPGAIRACTSIIRNQRTKREGKADALLNRGDAHRLQGRKREALADYRTAHKIAEELFDLGLVRLAAMSAAEIAFDLKEYVVATFMYIDAYDEEEANTETKYNLRFLAAVSAARAGQPDVAIGFFDEAIAILPNEARGYRERGAAYTQQKEHDKALTRS